MFPLTAQFITKNNQETIESSLQSAVQLKANILVADLGSKDRTKNICKHYNAEIVQLDLNHDLSQIYNELLRRSKTSWNLYLQPGERILTGFKQIAASIRKQPAIYQFKILQNDLVTRSKRMWHKDTQATFLKPAFSTLSGTAEDLNVIIASENSVNPLNIEIIEYWRQCQPLASEPCYYAACIYLSQQNFTEFLNHAEKYLFMEKQDNMSTIMTRYYIAYTLCCVKKKPAEAIQYLSRCLVLKPLMSEFWCLLGDIYYQLRQYGKAKIFYENAIILGSRRLNSDDWPLEISKYKEYPEKMLNTCQNILDSIQRIGIQA